MKTIPESAVGDRGARGRLRLGELLVSEGLITMDALGVALASSAATGNRLGRVLVQTGAISEESLAKLLGAADFPH